MLSVTFLAVGKVIIAVMIGAYTYDSIPFAATTMDDFRFLISTALLPALTVYNTALSVDTEVLKECFVLIFLSLLATVISIGYGFVFERVLFSSKRGPPRRTGVPVELSRDVRLVLRYDQEALPRRSRSANDGGSAPSSPASPTSPASPSGSPRQFPNNAAAGSALSSSKGVPYVGVRLSKRWHAAGVEGHEVVAQLLAPDRSEDCARGYAWASYVAFTMQNTTIIPISLLESFSQSLPWVRFDEGMAYVFVYSIIPTVFMWTFGLIFVAQGKRSIKRRRTLRLLLEEHLTRRRRCDRAVQVGLATHDDGSDDEGHSRREVADGDGDGVGTCEAYPYDWESDGLLRVLSRSSTSSPAGGTAPTAAAGSSPATDGNIEDEDDEEEEDVSFFTPFLAALPSLRDQSLKLFLNPPFLSLLVGMVIGSVPFLRGLFFDGGILSVVMDATSLIAQGGVPSSLLLLGSNLASANAAGAAAADGVAEEECGSNSRSGLLASLPRMVRSGHVEHHVRSVGTSMMEDDDEECEDNDREGDVAAVARSVSRSREQRDFSPGSSATSTSTSTSHAIGAPEGPYVLYWRYDNEGRLTRYRGEDYEIKISSECIVADVEGEEEEGMNGSSKGGSVTRRLTSSVVSVLSRLRSDYPLFLHGTNVSRLLILPFIFFILFMAAVTIAPSLTFFGMPYDRTMILVLFMEFCSPTAIFTVLIFNQEKFLAGPWATLMFLQYVMSIASTILFMWWGLRFTENLPDPA